VEQGSRRLFITDGGSSVPGDGLGVAVNPPPASPTPSNLGVDLDRLAAAVREILIAVGEDPDREGLRATPVRVARMYAEIFSGLHEDPGEHLRATFEADHDELVLVRDIPIYSVCEHHLLPWLGKAHVAYIPGNDGRITGLSKLARLVEGFAKRPQVQERLTSQIADTMVQKLNPLGVLVVIEAEHLCMSMRGVKKPGAVTVTSAVRGHFLTSAAARAEVLGFVQRPS
jgi:GTP cyclohydrolase I